MRKNHLCKRVGTWLLLTVFIYVSTTVVVPPAPVSASALPGIIITEMCVNAMKSDTDTADAFEFIEFKNTTGSSINMSGYSFKQYNISGTLLRTFAFSSTFTVPAGGIRVMWIKCDASVGLTAQNFVDFYNAHYPGLGLTTASVYTCDVTSQNGLQNTGYRKITLSNAGGTLLCYAEYNDSSGNDSGNTRDIQEQNSSILYQYPATYLLDGIKKMTKVAVNQSPPTPGIIPAAPPLQITELMTNPTTAPGITADAYEYIEVYNDTASAVDLSGYRFRFYAPDDSTYVTWDVSSSFNIPSKGYGLVWLMTSASVGKTLADFNNYYFTNFTTAQVYPLDLTVTTGLVNTGKHTVALTTDAGAVICKATYNDGTADDTTATVDCQKQDTGCMYAAPVKDAVTMLKVGGNQPPSPADPYAHYIGQLHNHSTHSDGNTAPATAYAIARDTAKAHYFSLTEHSQSFDSPLDWQNSTEWAAQKQIADQYTVDGQFVGIRGFETSWNVAYGWWTHMNTLNTDWFVSHTDNGLTLPDLYGRLTSDPDSISQFNHPNPDGYGDAYDFGYYSTQRDAVIPLCEITSAAASGYMRALDKGWHAAPAKNGDTHTDQFLADGRRTMILSDRLTREALVDAVRNRRFYAVDDYTGTAYHANNGDLRMMFKIDGNVMGSRLNTAAGMLNFAVDAYDPVAADTISKVRIFAEGGMEVYAQTYGTNVVHLNVTLPNSHNFYWVRVDQTDGGVAYSAPIWITNNNSFHVSMDQRAMKTAAPQVGVTVSSAAALSNVTVDLFYDTHVYNAAPVATGAIASVPAGGDQTVWINWPGGSYPLTGSHKIIAKVSAAVGGVTKTRVNYAYISQLLVTEVVVNSADDAGQTGDQYEYVELYNNSPDSVNLNGFKLQYHYGPTSDYKEHIFGSFTLASGQNCVIWLKDADSQSKTKTQFRSHYGVSSTTLPDARIYAPAYTAWTNADGTAYGWTGLANDEIRKIYIKRVSDDMTVTKAWYSDGVPINSDAATDGSCITYKYTTDGTQKQMKTGVNIKPCTPGTVSASQVPE